MALETSRRAALAGLVAAAWGCGSRPDVITKTGAGKELGEAEIDADPVALLPGSALAIGYLDARKLYASSFGQKLHSQAERRMPLPPAAGYDPRRDLETLWVGVYSMQGVDVAGVAIGNFDRQKIEAAADGTQMTPLGTPVVKSSYAGRTLYTSAEVGFAVLSSRTALFGNDVGIRRALDRIAEGRVKAQLPRALRSMFAAPSAPLVVGADLTSNPVPNAARQELAFFDGVRTLALLGNFDDPGLNLAGTLSYENAEAAQRGAQNLVALRATLERYAPFLALMGIPQPIRRLEAQPKQNEATFVMAIDGNAATALLERGSELLSPRR